MSENQNTQSQLEQIAALIDSWRSDDSPEGELSPRWLLGQVREVLGLSDLDYLTRALSSLLTEAGESPHPNPAELVTQVGTVMRRARRPMTDGEAQRVAEDMRERAALEIEKEYITCERSDASPRQHLEWAAKHVRALPLPAVAQRPAPLTEEEAQALILFARDIATGYDHEKDAHRYNNGACRVCNAEKLLFTIGARGETPPEVRPSGICACGHGVNMHLNEKGACRAGWATDARGCMCDGYSGVPVLTPSEEAEIIASAPGTIAVNIEPWYPTIQEEAEALLRGEQCPGNPDRALQIMAIYKGHYDEETERRTKLGPSRELVEALYQLGRTLETKEQRNAHRVVNRVVHDGPLTFGESPHPIDPDSGTREAAQAECDDANREMVAIREHRRIECDTSTLEMSTPQQMAETWSKEADVAYMGFLTGVRAERARVGDAQLDREDMAKLQRELERWTPQYVRGLARELHLSFDRVREVARLAGFEITKDDRVAFRRLHPLPEMAVTTGTDNDDNA